jgi:hypothetical protein
MIAKLPRYYIKGIWRIETEFFEKNSVSDGPVSGSWLTVAFSAKLAYK